MLQRLQLATQMYDVIVNDDVTNCSLVMSNTFQGCDIVFFVRMR